MKFESLCFISFFFLISFFSGAENNSNVIILSSDEEDNSSESDSEFHEEMTKETLFSLLRKKSAKELKALAKDNLVSLHGVCDKVNVIHLLLEKIPRDVLQTFVASGNDSSNQIDEKASSRKHVSEEVWENLPEEEVEAIPYDINGDKVYVIKRNNLQSKQLLTPKDERPFEKPQTADKIGIPKGCRKLQRCRGSNICNDESCMYFHEYDKQNRVLFKNNEMRQTVCKCCNLPVIFIPCLARKITVFFDTYIKIFHWGTHTCVAVPLKEASTIKKGFRSDSRIKPCQLQKRVLIDSTPDNGSRLSGTATSGLEGRVPQLQIKLLTQLQKAFCFLLFWRLSRLFP